MANRKPNFNAWKLQDLTGRTFGRLTVLGRAQNIGKETAWRCRCECGQEKVARATKLKCGETRSCGCLRREITGRSRRRHGRSKTPEYNIWCGMIRRCSSSKPENAKHYLGRGIKVVRRWRGRKGFANFFADMGPRPSPRHSIERLNNDGDYSPSNCVWATKKEQGRNTRTNRLIEFRGQVRCLAEWAEIYNLDANALRHRLNVGWDLERALTTPSAAKSRGGA